jgi:hypothetical protein
MGKTKKSIRDRAGRKTSKARKLVTRKLVSGKNKKTHRKGKKQTGGRRRPNGLGTGGASSVSPNNANMYEGGPDYLNTAEEAEAIRLIQANNLEGLRRLLDARTFSDDGALMDAVTMAEPNIEIISEVMSRTPISEDTEINISDAIHENPELLTEVLEILHAEEARQEEARLLQEQEQKQANNNGRPSTPPPPMKNE